MRLALALACLLLVTGAAAGLWLWQRALPVTTAPARIGSAIEAIYATGVVEPEQPVAAAAQTTGPVVEVYRREGDRVRRGEPLLRIDDSEQRATIVQLAALAAGASADERRALRLFEQGWATAATRDAAVAAATAARAAERAARQRLDIYAVRAGIDGIVLKRDVEPGDLVTPSRTLFLLGDPRRLRVTATVDERDVPRLLVGQAAEMSTDAYPGQIVRGRVVQITPGGDPLQRAFRARIALPRGNRLPIGLTLEVNIVTRRVNNALLIPERALAGEAVWVLKGGRLQRRVPRLGIRGSDSVQIEQGLESGEQVLIDPPADLKEGRRAEARK